MDEADELLRLFSRLDRLAELPRTGWLVAGVDEPESIADHVFGVAIVAMWLADRVEADVDTERLLRIALLHDAGEALLTDLPRPVKELIGRDDVDEAEAEACRRLFVDVDGWEESVEAYRRQESDEARLVKAADRIQMAAKALVYRSQGRGDVERFGEELESIDDYGFPIVGEIFERLRERWEADDWFPADLD